MAPARLLTFSAERPVEPGRCRREGFEPPFTIDVPDGWFAFQDIPGFFDLERDVGTLDVIAVQFARLSDVASVATAADTIRARPGLIVEGPTAIEVGGAPGVRLVVDAAGPDIEAQVFVPVLEIALGPISIASGRRLELRLVDTAAGLLAVLLGGSVRTWEGAREAAEPILASIHFDSDHDS
ncbi:MAG TPA: hypothetical protein VGQ85_02585 [Candidatus Limnocylindrales bacterium]|nr:hypothetical protein [Candidatus Limnocylindrales bacterium]